MRLAYDGRDFYGYQYQKNRRTVQGEIEDLLSYLFKEEVTTKASGRTDSGVHALDQVVGFTAPKLMELSRLSYVLRRLLPRDIMLNSISYSDIHPRFDALAKTYEFRCSYDDDLFLRPYALILAKPLDLRAMRKAALYLEGEHDFYNFSNRRVGEGSTRRHLYQIRIKENQKSFTIACTGEGFLYKMVRIIVAYLLNVGGGKIPYQGTPEIIKAKDRKDTRQVAPPQGLFLKKVFYDKKELEKYLLENK